ncbi:hypothetical protein D9Q98_000687 [Chlorella vulgaris]|uniref:Carbohydrate kinase PfkB domain-containing protein n=1 Tax=Chlorella vulgaris TaxID=3077 RepID=A0A9D4Z2G9_CHLVU|nr:hypothetical protein D9Q98_000687 [Chlorella vulgaris]
MAALQLLVFDTRRGNKEGEENDKVLAGFPDTVSLLQQSSMAGLLQGLLLFTANFTTDPHLQWDVAETDSGTWVMHEAEPHLWFAALAARQWLPRHTSEHTLRSLLTQAHLLTTALCGSVQAMLDKDPGGGLARAGLQAVVGHLGRALGSPASWQHRELRNPLGDASLPPLLQLSSGAALAVQSLCNNLLLANVSGRQPVQGMLLLYGPYLLWSTLAARDTAALFALLATGLLHATSTSKSCKPTNGSQADGVNAAASDGGSPAAVHPDLRALDGGWWQQLPSGFLVQRGAKEARAAATAAAVDGAAQPAVPLVHLQHGPMGQGQGQVKGQQQQQQGSSGGDGQWVTHHLLPLLEGRLLLVMLLGTDTQLSAELLADLHDWVAGPAKQLATQIGDEVRESRSEASHLPGFRYLYQDSQQLASRTSPRIKVSAMSHHARTLAAAVRESLGAAPGMTALAQERGHAAAGATGIDSQAAAGAGLLRVASSFGARDSHTPDPSSSGNGSGTRSTGNCDGCEVLEVVARSSQDCWAYAAQPGGGRRLLAVRERRSERDLPEAAGVLQAFAEDNFLIALSLGVGMAPKLYAALFCVVAALLIARQLSTPAITIVGNVTIDLVDGKKALGGAVSYAAAVASAFGVRACIVTAAAPDVDLGTVFDGHDLVVIPSSHTLVFEHTYTFWGNHRKLRVPAQPNVTLSMRHLPARCRRARTLLLGPLMPADLDPASFVVAQPWWHALVGLPWQQVGLMAQGLQRQLDASGRVQPLRDPSPLLVDALGASTSVFLSDVETDTWPNTTVAQLAHRTSRFLVTRGKDGADEYVGCTAVTRHPVFQVSAVLDTNGAGDTFATAYMLAVAAGHASPVTVAHWAGGLAVSKPQACKPACVTGALQAGWSTMPASPRHGWLPVQRLLLLPPVRQLAQLLGLAAPRGAKAVP